MRVDYLGGEDPDYSLVCCLHGDEVSGKEALDRLSDRESDLMEPVKVILANERAYEEDTRYIDQDLNRSFPGSLESNVYEEREAAKILEEVRGTKVLDIHSSEADSAPFGVMIGHGPEKLEMARATGLDNFIDLSHVTSGSMLSEAEGVAIELEKKGKDSADIAYQTVTNYLSSLGILQDDYQRSDPEVFLAFDEVPKPGEDNKFLASNFEIVNEDEVFAYTDENEVRAGEDFYPVLMSSEGYPEIFGFQAEKLGKASEF